MDDEKKMKFWRRIFSILNFVLITVIAILDIATFEALLHCILCTFALLLTTISLVLDGIVKDIKSLCMNGLYYLILSAFLIENLFKI